MKLTQIVGLVNTKLAGETLTYNQMLPYLDGAIIDINSNLNSCFPTFSELYPTLDIEANYDLFPDRYITSVVVIGAAFKFYTTDEEGISTAQGYQVEYNQGMFYMIRDYSANVPEMYKASNQGYIEGPAPSSSGDMFPHKCGCSFNVDIRYVEGPEGRPGPTGPAGPKGEKGDKGDQGEKGEKGDKGDMGYTGPTGLTGPKGDTGPKGPKGDTGAQGPKGDVGATGKKGDKGDKGEAGYTPVRGVDYWTAEDQAAVSADLDSKVANKADKDIFQYYGEIVTPSPESYFTVNATGETITGLTTEGKTQTELVIPYKINEVEITTIDDGAFNGCTSLTSVSIPNSVTSIGHGAFYYCTALTSINIPNSVISIGNSIFEGCAALTSINIPNSVTSIGTSAFEDCTSLRSVNISNGVTTIYEYTFKGCTSLKSVNIPNSVTTIGTNAFANCTSLTLVNILSGVTTIDDGAFNGCTSLTSVSIPNSVTSIEFFAFHVFDSTSSSHIPIPGLTIYCEQGSYAETYAKTNDIPYVYTDIKATSINPAVKTAVEDTITVNTIYDLGVQTSLSLTLPSGTVGDFIQADFISGETATTLTVNSSSGLVGFDLITGVNTIYTLYFDWGVIGYNGTDVAYGWRFNYSEYSIDV